MKKQTIWQRYYLASFLKLQIKRSMRIIFKKNIAFVPKPIKRKQMNLNETQEYIRQMIRAGKPALISRFGSNEAYCIAEGIGIKYGKKKKFSRSILNRIYINAGVFPHGEKMALRFGEISAEAAAQVDLLGFWTSFMQDYLALEVCKKDMALTQLGYLEPYYSDTPWSAELKGKKYWLFIHSKHPLNNNIKNANYYLKIPTFFRILN